MAPEPFIGFIVVLAVIAIVIAYKVTDSRFNRTVIVIATIVIMTCNITCVVTDPPDPRVSVSGYTTSSGKKVSGYSRKYPGQRDEDSPYKGILIACIIGTIVISFYAIAKHDGEKEREREHLRDKARLEKEKASWDAHIEQFKQTTDIQIVRSDNTEKQESGELKQTQITTKREDLPSWFYVVIDYAGRIGAKAYVLENPIPKNEMDSINQIKGDTGSTSDGRT